MEAQRWVSVYLEERPGRERGTDSPYDDRSIRRKNTAVIDRCDRPSGVCGHVIDGTSTNGAQTQCTGLFPYPTQNLYFHSIYLIAPTTRIALGSTMTRD
jgi:hypothetical protein